MFESFYNKKLLKRNADFSVITQYKKYQRNLKTHCKNKQYSQKKDRDRETINDYATLKPEWLLLAKCI